MMRMFKLINTGEIEIPRILCMLSERRHSNFKKPVEIQRGSALQSCNHKKIEAKIAYFTSTVLPNERSVSILRHY